MSLAEALSSQAPKPSPCKFARVASQLPEADQKVLASAMEDTRSYSTRQIARALNTEGQDISHTSVQMHRDQQCSCWRTRAPHTR